MHLITASPQENNYVSYSNSLADEFDDRAMVHSYNLNILITSDRCFFVNYFLTNASENWYGDGEFEISTFENKVVAINYITTVALEMMEPFIQKVRDFINGNLEDFIRENGKQLIH